MYWFRLSITHSMPFVFLMLAAWSGGWLLATHALRVRERERLLAGLATGIVLYTALCNLLAILVGSTWAFILSALLLLGLGVVAAWRAKKAWLHLGDLHAWPQILTVLVIGAVFTLILRGLSIWDDYHNLPIVSTMAAGNLPPRYYLDPSFPLSYHYGLHVFAASMVATGGFTPWSAWDLARGFTTALAIVLGWVWFKRVTGSSLAAHFGATLLTFGGGTLWLLSLLPNRLLTWVSAHAPLANSSLDSGPNLAANLSRPFLFIGGPPLQMPFAFLGSLFAPVIINWNGTSSFYLVCIFLLLLENERRRFSVIPILVSGIVFSMIALNAEYVYGLLFAGVVLAILVAGFRNRREKRAVLHGLGRILATLSLSLVIALLQGGVLTVLLQNFFHGNTDNTLKGLGTAGFFFQWPPALIADFFKPLSMANPAQILVALAEIGPTLFLLPIVAVWTWKLAKRGHLVEAGLGVSGLIGFFVPFLLHYSVERDTSRISSYGLQIFLILSVPALVLFVKQGKAWLRDMVLVGFGLSITGGLVTFAMLYSAITTPQLAYFIDAQDARMSSQAWNQLKPAAWVLDRIPYRSVTLFGRSTRSSPTSGPVDFSTYPEWKALTKDPQPGDVAAAGFQYIYMDSTWWNQLTPEQQSSLHQNCVKIVQETGDVTTENFRQLLDVSQCK